MRLIRDLVKNYGAQYSVALIYIAFMLISLFCSFILFKFLNGTGVLKLATTNYIKEAEFGGSIAGFLIMIIFLIKSYSSNISKYGVVIKGNVVSEDGNPIEHALVFIEGIDKQKYTDKTGWFSIEVDSLSQSWNIRTTYDGLSSSRKVTRNDTQTTIILELKKK